MDIDKLFTETREHHGAGHFSEAVAGYEQLLAHEPGNAQFCYLLAMLYFEQDNFFQAQQWFSKTAKLAPEATPAHYNLGVIAFEQGKSEEAINCYEKAAALDPTDTDTLFNLALALKQAGRLSQAKEIYLRILELAPQESDTLYNLGVLSKDMGEHDQAIRYFEQTLKQQKDHLQALNNLGYLYHRQQQPHKAISTYKQLIAQNYNSSAAQHMLAALSGTSTVTAPVDYVRDVFDQFSDHYEESLVDKLEYRTPAMLRDMLQRNGNTSPLQHGLDMGCGTGLSGEAFHSLCPSLIGLDLSPKMLALAAKKEIYQELFEEDIVTFLQQQYHYFNLFIAADVFVYIGDLSDIFTQIQSSASQEAVFLFSTEQTKDEGFELKSSGRYGHSREYIAELTKTHDFTIIESQPANIRKERGEWIAGNLWMLQKRS